MGGTSLAIAGLLALEATARDSVQQCLWRFLWRPHWKWATERKNLSLKDVAAAVGFDVAKLLYRSAVQRTTIRRYGIAALVA
jgi:hypothetical protein